jgi:hypothetical protein
VDVLVVVEVVVELEVEVLVLEVVAKASLRYLHVADWPEVAV